MNSSYSKIRSRVLFTMSDCPSIDALDALVGGALSDEDFSTIEAHVESCTACQALLAARCDGTREVPRLVIGAEQAVSTPGNWDDQRRGRILDAIRNDSPELTGPCIELEQVGTVIAGRYKLLERIGEGGMGEVWVAEQSQPVRRKVALKLIKAGMDSKTVLSRFEAERQALAIMDDPNIAKVFDGGHTELGRPYFVMEYVKGASITQFCDEVRLSVPERLALFVAVCHAMQHAHQRGIIHRDLKPSNILVCLHDGVPVPKVIDFGLAKAMHQPLTEHTQFTAYGAMVGTPAYMSPEQADLTNLDIDTRTDIYSLGVVLYELLTGTTPLDKKRFRETSLPELLRLIKEEDPPRPSLRLNGSDSLPSIAANRQLESAKMSRRIRGELDWIVMKCLEKQRSRRYESANSLARDIERHLNDEPVEACPPSAGYRLKKVFRRHKGPVMAASLVLLALIGGIAGMAWGFLEASDQRDRTQLALEEKNKQWQRAEDNALEARHQRTEALKQKRDAEEQAAIARAVNDFLNRDLFGQRDILEQSQRDPNLTVRELLDRASVAVADAFRDQPLVEAAVRQTLADAYDDLYDTDKSMEHQERAYQLRLAYLGADHPDTLSSKRKIAVTHCMLGDLGRGVTLLEEVVATATEIHGSDAIETLHCKESLATNYGSLGRYAEGERLFQEVLAARLVTLGPNDGKTIWVRGELGGLYRAWDKLDEARPHLEEVLNWYRVNTPADHPHAQRFAMYLADLYRREGKYEQAEAIFKQAVEYLTVSLGANNRRTQLARLGLAWNCCMQKKYELADSHYQELFQYAKHEGKTTSPNGYFTVDDLKQIAVSFGNHESTVLLLQSAIEASTQVHGLDHTKTQRLIENLGWVYETVDNQE